MIFPGQYTPGENFQEVRALSKTLFVDCDNTLVYHGPERSYIPESTYVAINELQERGHHVVLTTGRSYFESVGVMRDLGMTDAICNNGALIILDNIIVHREPINPKKINEIIKILLPTQSAIYATDMERRYVSDPRGEIATFLANFARPGYRGYEKDEPEPFYPLDDIMREYYVFFVIPDTTSRWEEITPFLDGLARTDWGDDVIDLANAGVSKYTGIEWVKEHYGLRHEDLYAFGDSYNDVEMLQHTAHGIIMGNAPERLHIYADYVAPRVEDDGFYAACKHYGLI